MDFLSNPVPWILSYIYTDIYTSNLRHQIFIRFITKISRTLLITHQVTEVACPVIGEAQPELTPSKRQKRILNMIFKAGFHFAGRTFDSQS